MDSRRSFIQAIEMAYIHNIDRNTTSNGSNSCKQKSYIHISHMGTVFKNLQKSREDEDFCDLRLQTDDGTIIPTHKIVLVAGCPYFNSMFKGFKEMSLSLINIREVESTSLKLLIDFIYTGEILITEQNVMGLMPVANMLQLELVKNSCVEFLKSKLNPSNCLGIRQFADLYNARELFRSSEEYIKKYFPEVVQGEEFLSLTSEAVIKLISSDDINIPFEEIVFECVYKWVKYELNCRYDSLPALMEHVRLPLVSLEYLTNVIEDPLLRKCYDFVTEAVNLTNSPIRITPRKFYALQKVILVLSYSRTIGDMCLTNWYDPAFKVWQIAPKLDKFHLRSILAVVRNQYVFTFGSYGTSFQMLDLNSQSPSWELVPDMLVSRDRLGVGVLDNCLYAIGGDNDAGISNDVEVFDITTQQWRIISSMSQIRTNVGVGILNNFVYAVGGFVGTTALKSVECYNPSLDTWTEIAKMSQRRFGASVAVLDGKLYAIGGHNLFDTLNSVETYEPSDGVWTSVADMNMCRAFAGVFALDGLLYVIGGTNRYGFLNSIEIYNPITNTWSMETLSTSDIRIYDGVVVDMVPNFRTNPWYHCHTGV